MENTQDTKQMLHRLIDQIEDQEVLMLYVKLLEHELRRDEALYGDMRHRADRSEQDIAAGRVKSFDEFNANFEAWKAKKRTNTK
jgi:hypothetical protein